MLSEAFIRLIFVNIYNYALEKSNKITNVIVYFLLFSSPHFFLFHCKGVNVQISYVTKQLKFSIKLTNFVELFLRES